MENFTKSIDRLSKFIDYKGISFNKLATIIGVSNSYFSKMVKNKASIGSDILEKIVRVYPDMNSNWLLTGEGEMIKNTKENFAKEAESNYFLQKNASVMNELYANLKYFRQRCEKLEKEIDELKLNQEIHQSKQAG